jgi:hypothetical protein
MAFFSSPFLSFFLVFAPVSFHFLCHFFSQEGGFNYQQIQQPLINATHTPYLHIDKDGAVLSAVSLLRRTRRR